MWTKHAVILATYADLNSNSACTAEAEASAAIMQSYLCSRQVVTHGRSIVGLTLLLECVRFRGLPELVNKFGKSTLADCAASTNVCTQYQ